LDYYSRLLIKPKYAEKSEEAVNKTNYKMFTELLKLRYPELEKDYRKKE